MNSDNSKNITEEQQFDSIPLLDNQGFFYLSFLNSFIF